MEDAEEDRRRDAVPVVIREAGEIRAPLRRQRRETFFEFCQQPRQHVVEARFVRHAQRPAIGQSPLVPKRIRESRSPHAIEERAVFRCKVKSS